MATYWAPTHGSLPISAPGTLAGGSSGGGGGGVTSGVRRLVTIDGATITEVKDLEVADTYMAVRDSFQVKAADRQTAMSGSGRRYQGLKAVSESHGNAEVSWKALVRGTTPDEVFQNVESMVASVEPLDMPGLHLEWRPDGLSQSTFYEVRGPAKWQPTWQWAQFTGARSMLVDVTKGDTVVGLWTVRELSVSEYHDASTGVSSHR